MCRVFAIAIVAVLAAGPADVWASQTRVTAAVEAQAIKQMAASVPLGSLVKVHVAGSRSFKGTLLSVSDDAIMVKKQTRVPEPAVTVAFSELDRLELQTHEGISVAKVIGFGLAAGAGAILTIIGFAFAISD